MRTAFAFTCLLFVAFVTATLAGAFVPSIECPTPKCSTCDIVVPLSGCYELDRDTTVNCVEIRARGKLLTNGYTLTLTGPGGSTIHGDLFLNEASSVLLVDQSDHVISGTGSITGGTGGASIQVTGGLMLTSKVRITGALQIHGLWDALTEQTGAFINNGIVEANASDDTILVHGDTDLRDGSGLWSVTTALATLDFDAGTPCEVIVGVVKVSAGVLRIDTNVTFSDFEWDGGVLFGQGGERLRYETYNAGSTKPNPYDGTEECNSTGITFFFVDEYPKT